MLLTEPSLLSRGTHSVCDCREAGHPPVRAAVILEKWAPPFEIVLTTRYQEVTR
jgi:hypothetical protein